VNPQFKTFVSENASLRGISLRELARRIGIDPSNFSNILNGKRKLDEDLIKKIADFFGVPRVVAYQKAGWLDEFENDRFVVQRFREVVEKDKNLADLFDKIMSTEEPDRSERIRLFLTTWKK
jgi:transcriptional regulator with XRE-family HTH domain